MKLYLIRHGEAGPAASDGERVLNAHGRAQVTHLAQQLQEAYPKPQHIYHSGILRAVQTAEIIAEIWEVPAPSAIEDFLPEASPIPMLHAIHTWTEDTVLVGHLPYLSHLLASLSEEGHYITFDTATAVCLERVRTKWFVQGVWHP